MAKLKSAEDILMMEKAGNLAARTLVEVQKIIKPGISTEDINELVHRFITENGAYPSPLNYRGFPKSVCTSVNEVICHGIPSSHHILKEGDIINVDVTCELNGFLGDTSKMYIVGSETTKERQLVMDVAHESLARALAIVQHKCRLGDIGHAIQSYAEGEKGCGVVRDFIGHGIGTVFHEPELQVPHYGKKNTGMKLIRGMTFTIEPMINAGDWRANFLSDGWTAVTIDGKPSAQYEHTLAIVGDGIKILTALPGDSILERAKELGAKIIPLDIDS